MHGQAEGDTGRTLSHLPFQGTSQVIHFLQPCPICQQLPSSQPVQTRRNRLGYHSCNLIILPVSTPALTGACAGHLIQTVRLILGLLYISCRSFCWILYIVR